MPENATKLEILQYIERQYPVEDIKIGGEQFWPFFRMVVYSELMKDILQIHKRTFLTPVRKLANSFLGLPNWFRKTDYVFVSNELERKKLNGRYFDKLTEYYIEKLGIENCLYVELVERSHLPARQYKPKKVASFDLILLIAGFLKVVANPVKNIHIEGENILKEIFSELKLSKEYHNRLAIFLCKVNAMRWFLKRIGPKAVFITDYGYMPVAYAAKSLGIKVVEFQHGVIGKVHPFYHPAKKLCGKFCPDMLLALGKHDVDSLSHGKYVNAKNIFAVGNYYLEKIKKLPLNDQLMVLLKNYEKSVCIPTDRITHAYLLSFIREVAVSLPKVVFILVPRNVMEVGHADLPTNVRVETSLSFQEVVRHCTFNSCTISTCSLEALTLGITNILIDEDGATSAYYGKILTDTRATKFAKTKKEYIELLKSTEPLSKEEVMMSNQENVVPHYEENVKETLTEILS